MSSTHFSKEHVTRYCDGNDVKLLQYANNQRNAGVFNDVTVKVGGESIPANRMVLSCFSKFFESAFRSPFQDQYQNTVEIHQFEEKAVKEIIDYIYTSRIDIIDENVMDLLAVADFLQVESVKKFCFEYFEKTVSNENCIEIVKAAHLYCNRSSMKKTYRLISKNFDQIWQESSFINLRLDELRFLLGKLDKTKVKIKSLFNSIIHWTQKKQSRKAEFPELFLNLELHKLPMEFLRSVVEKEQLVKEHPECAKAVVESVARKLKSKESKILSLGGYNNRTVAEVYSTSDDSEKKYMGLPDNFGSHSATKINDFIYCIGHCISRTWEKLPDQIYQLNITQPLLPWQPISAVCGARSNTSAVNFHNNLVVTGGWHDSGISNAATVYEVGKDTWKEIAPMKYRRIGHNLIATEDSIFAIGGKDEYDEFLFSMERLDGFDENWIEVTSIRNLKSGCATVSCDGCIYIIGGVQDGSGQESKTVEMYDPHKDEWVYVSELNVERYLHSACCLDGKIYVLGGRNLRGEVHTIECYDPKLNQWKIVGDTQHDLECPTLVAI